MAAGKPAGYDRRKRRSCWASVNDRFAATSIATQNDANPDQVGGRVGVRNGLAERMPLQEFQMRLLASLPARDRLEGVDVPADQFCERRGALPSSAPPCDG
jgi:hypothetical protein